MEWYVYKITNLLNNKCYVGQRKLPVNKTIYTDNYMGSGTILAKSIKKNGKEHFKKEILKSNIFCQTAVNLYEEKYINSENTLMPNGYNLKSSCMNGSIHSEYTKHKISVSLRKLCRTFVMTEQQKLKISNALKGYLHSEETKNKQSILRKGKYVGILSPFYGRKLSEETKLKISNSIKEENHPLYNKNHSDETKEKISITKTGIPSKLIGTNISESHKLKIANSHLGKVQSKESIDKMANTRRDKANAKYALLLPIFVDYKLNNISVKTIIDKMNITEGEYNRLMKLYKQYYSSTKIKYQ